jgi:RNA polymerase sigma-70 factor (ECF subfamily)
MSLERSESDLIRQAVGGDRAALSHLLLMHHAGLHRHVARRICGDLRRLVTADDVLHQTFVRAAQGIGRFEPRHEGAFRGWLTTIADNLIRDAEKRKRRERRAWAQPGPDPKSSWAALVEKIAGDGSSPSVRTQRRENSRRLRAALAVLPEDHREVIERYYLQEQSLAEIAEAMGGSKGSIRAVCYRARKRLRELMGRSSLYFSG